MPDTLKPCRCPKCGGSPVLEHGDDMFWRVKCWWDKSCRHKTDWYETEEEAIDAWQRRAGHEPAGECAEHNRAERGAWCGEEGEKDET